MNGTCQTCGTSAPIEWFLSETEHRQICAVLVKLPKEIQAVIFHYLALFKPTTGRAIQAKKASRLMAEINEMVTAGHIQVDRKVARPCPPRLWAQAMEQMIERRDRLSLPMPNHNYLKSIAWDLADQADAQAERTRSQAPARTVSNARMPESILNPLDQYIQGLRDTKPSDEEMAEWKEKQLR